jgi:hypothetical protein
MKTTMINGYSIFCSTCFVALGACQYVGFCFADYDRIPDVPTSVRSNPGSYRSHYSSHYVHITGK